MNYIGFVNKGLEAVGKIEIEEKIKDAQITECGIKRIVFSSEMAISEINSLRTIDDICWLIFEKNEVKTAEEIISCFSQINVAQFRDTFSKITRQNENAFSLTLSIVGIKDFNQTKFISVLAKNIETTYGWQFLERDHSLFDLRVFVDHGRLLVGVRVNKDPLSKRAYKQFAKIGSLKPTIAAAMVLIATKGKTGSIVDTFCGSGTVVCEALALGNTVYGSDIDLESVENCRKNLQLLDRFTSPTILQQNAMKTLFGDHLFDYGVSNLPWDKQIKISSITELYENVLQEYKRILKKEGVLCVLITKPELFIKYARSIFTIKEIERYPLSLLGQSPEIVCIRF